MRLLRLLRFAARFDFKVDDQLLLAAREASVQEALRELWARARGRVLFELKKAHLTATIHMQQSLYRT